MVGATPARPIDHDDPIHRERIQRYERNIVYYQLAQYADINRRALAEQNFLALRINYSTLCQRSVELKSDWLFGDPVGVNAIPLGDDGKPIDHGILENEPEPVPFSAADTGEEPSPQVPADPAKVSAEGAFSLVEQVKDKINQVRDYNQSDYWDWVMAVMGMVCGDFFVQIDAQADDLYPSVSLLDPSYVFPDYPSDITKPMRACQIQYEVDDQGDTVSEEYMPSNRRIVEDYRLEVIGENNPDELDELAVISDERFKEIGQDEIGGMALGITTSTKLTCIYRKFEDGQLISGSKRDIGIPAIPIVHGLNSNIWNKRYGTDEVSSLIPMLEKYNETYFYAERIGRHNAHAKLFLSGVRSETTPIKADFDDVIYGGQDSSANVITLPTDTSVLSFTTDAIAKEMHRTAHIPVIAEGEAEAGYGTPSGLALMIRFGPLQAITGRHHTSYGMALSSIYVISLMFDEMVIDGKAFGSKWKYDTWRFQHDWCDMMPKSEGEIITNMIQATGGKQLLSARSARERIPNVDPQVEEERIKQEDAQDARSMAALNALAPAGPGGPGDTQISPDQGPFTPAQPFTDTTTGQPTPTPGNGNGSVTSTPPAGNGSQIVG